MDKGAWRATVHRVTKSQTQLKRLSTHANLYAGAEPGCEGCMGVKTDKYPCPHRVYSLVEVGDKNHTAVIAHYR